jgi:hypothetical protein
MTLPLRRSVTATAVLIAATWLLPACSSAPSEDGAIGTSGAQPSAITLETSDQLVTITNNAGKPIEDVRISIQPVGTAPPYTTTLRRMENAEKREISLNEFRGNDGTTFSPRIFRAKQITVTATDIVGTKHSLTKAWKP